jgi:methylmalonyl-CoA/ethylmalonyl-CoA epimerase
MRTLPEGIPPTGQIAFVVRDLERALEQWSRLSIGPWNIWTFGPERLSQMTYRGRQQPYSMKIALCSIGPLTYELIEAVQGPNIYEEFLQQYGEGAHHLGYYVDDMSAATASMEGMGYHVIQSGSGFGVDGDGAFAYFDTQRDLGCIFEAIMVPKRMPQPERQMFGSLPHAAEREG